MMYALIWLIVLFVIYFVPTIVAIRRGHPQEGAITIINLFLGWTFIGWVVALAWACTAVPPKEG